MITKADKKDKRIYFRKQISSPKIIKAVRIHAGLDPQRGVVMASVEYLLCLGAKTFLENRK